MKDKNFSRRKFLIGSIGAGLVIAGAKFLPSCTFFRTSSSEQDYDAKGLPTAILGKTGVRIPRMALGLGSRFCNIKSPEESYELLSYALDNGLYYWDTAHIYENTDLGVVSEERIGEVVKTRRKEIFLSTKVTSRDPDEAMLQIEKSLKRLQTDHLDILKIHDVKSVEEVAVLRQKGNLIDIITKLKEQGVARFIGFSGHADAEALKMMVESGQFDSMLMAMNHYNGYTEKRQELAIPAAKAQGTGVMLMKVIRPKETIPGLDATDLVHYALSLKGPDGVIIGVDSMKVLKANLELLRNFKPMDESRMEELAMQLTPFYNHEKLPWMKTGYRDGKWA